MSYREFAIAYDYLMMHAPYDAWVEFVLQNKKKYEVDGNKLLDIACGTGELSLRLSRLSFDVTGVDLSAEMLSIAQRKAEQQNEEIVFFQQDMSELSSLGVYDVITIFCDSLNYLTSPAEVIATFQRVREHLRPGGLFLFDVHSVKKIEQYVTDFLYADNEEKVSYIWKAYRGDSPHAVDHELTLFVLDDHTNQYERFEEVHRQRTFTIDQYSTWLTKAGFIVQETIADFNEEEVAHDAERIFFVCQ